jgi:hypothetical protein
MPFFTGGKQADMGPNAQGWGVCALGGWGWLRLVAELRKFCRVFHSSASPSA